MLDTKLHSKGVEASSIIHPYIFYCHPMIRARKAVSAVPLPVPKNIQFEPPLPAQKQLLVQSYRYGYYTEVMAVFRAAWWTNKGFCGPTQSFKGPVSMYRDTSSPADSKWVLTCVLAGDAGRSWSQLSSAAERQNAILEQLAELYHGGDKSHLVNNEFVETVPRP